MFLVVGILLVGCVSNQNTREFSVDGNDYSYDEKSKRMTVNGDWGFTIEDSAKVYDPSGGVEITKIHHDGKPGCELGWDQLIIKGRINEDTYRLVKAHLESMVNCGYDYSYKVFLDSEGGSLYQGFKLGALFREKYVRAFIGDKAQCASSCAIAFLAATYRYIYEGGEIVFHAPYVRQSFYDSNSGINCALQKAKSDLNRYLNQILPEDTANYVYKRTMSVCSANDGWVINADAARLLGLSNVSKANKVTPGLVKGGALKLNW